MKITLFLLATLTTLSSQAFAAPTSERTHGRFQLQIAPQANQEKTPIDLVLCESGPGRGDGWFLCRNTPSTNLNGSYFHFDNGNIVGHVGNLGGGKPLKETLKIVQDGKYLTFDEVPASDKGLSFADAGTLLFNGHAKPFRNCDGAISLGDVEDAEKCTPVYITRHPRR